MRIRNRATAIRAISQSRARRTGRSKMLNAASARKNASSSAVGKKASNAFANSQSAAGNSQLKQYYIYEELVRTTDGLQQHAAALLKIGNTEKQEDNKEEKKEETKTLTAEELQEKDQEEKDNIILYVKKLVNTYNIIREDLGDIGSNANRVFQTQLKGLVKNYEKKLTEVGITMDKDGKLNVDDKALNKADTSKLKAIFCDKQGLSYDLKEKCETIEENASTSLRMINRMYGSSLNYNKYGTTNPYYNALYGKYSALG